jgi:hypothetical protein
MFKKPFNYKLGENRTCKLCGVEFYTQKPKWRCMQCLCKEQKKSQKPYQRKDTYPFDTRTNLASSRFCSIRTALSKAWKEYNNTGDKSVIIAHYDKQLKEIEENGILKWIHDRRTHEAMQEKRTKSTSSSRKDFPDTRGHYEY